MWLYYDKLKRKNFNSKYHTKKPAHAIMEFPSTIVYKLIKSKNEKSEK